MPTAVRLGLVRPYRIAQSSAPRRTRGHTNAAANATVGTADAGESGETPSDPKRVVEDALKNARTAARDAEKAMHEVHRLPSARRPNTVLRWARAAAKRVAVLALVGVTAWYLMVHQADPFSVRACVAATVTLLLAGGGYVKRSLDASGACAAAVVGLLTMSSSYAFAAMLIAFFVSSSALTRLAAKLKRKVDAEFKEGGQRNWAQVGCNGAVPSALALAATLALGGSHAPFLMGSVGEVPAAVTALQGGVLGYFACCCGDTWASEVGVLSKLPPFLVTSGRQVRRGTNGGVSPLGLGVSGAGGLLIGAVAAGFVITGSHDGGAFPRAALVAALGAASGFLGSLIDSLLGATLQFSGYDLDLDRVVSHPGKRVHRISGINLLTNNQVNLISASCTAALTALVCTCLVGGA